MLGTLQRSPVHSLHTSEFRTFSNHPFLCEEMWTTCVLRAPLSDYDCTPVDCRLVVCMDVYATYTFTAPVRVENSQTVFFIAATAAMQSTTDLARCGICYFKTICPAMTTTKKTLFQTSGCWVRWVQAAPINPN